MLRKFWSLISVALLFVWVVTACSEKGNLVETVAGGTKGALDGKGVAAQFNGPMDVAVDAMGNLFVADSANHLLRKITPDGEVITLAGSLKPGYKDGEGIEALFSTPTGIAVGPDGSIFLADSYEMDPHPMRVRKIVPTGTVSTYAGSSDAGYKDGAALGALFRTPANIDVDAEGNVYIADTNNNRIRQISVDGVVTTLAGPTEKGQFAGYVDGPAVDARFSNPNGVALGPGGVLYVADTSNHCIRKITPEGQVTTLAGSPEPGFADGEGIAAQFNYPTDVAVDRQGNVYVADSANHRIRKITPEGVVSTVAGTGAPGYLDGSPGEAQFRLPQGIAIDSQGVIYVADTGNNVIRRIIP